MQTIICCSLEELQMLIKRAVGDAMKNAPTKSENEALPVRFSVEDAAKYLTGNGCKFSKHTLYRTPGIPRDYKNGKLSFLREDLDKYIRKVEPDRFAEAAANLSRVARKKLKTA